MSKFMEALGRKLAWLRVNGDDTFAMAKYLIDTCAVADPAEVDRLRGVVAEKDGVIQMLHAIKVQDAENIDKVLADWRTLREHILDIDAHATPFGDIPDDPGWIGSYLISAGCLHRAMGKIGHSAPSCAAEAERDEALAEVEQLRGEIANLHPAEFHNLLTVEETTP